jgi:hypothetical protein
VQVHVFIGWAKSRCAIGTLEIMAVDRFLPGGRWISAELLAHFLGDGLKALLTGAKAF